MAYFQQNSIKSITLQGDKLLIEYNNNSPTETKSIDNQELQLIQSYCQAKGLTSLSLSDLQKSQTQQPTNYLPLIADRFGVNEKTIRRHLKPSDKPKQKRGRKEIFSPEILYALAHYTVYLETTTQKSLARDFSRWIKRPISQPTICRALKKAGIAYKKISYQALEQLRKKNQEKINHFINITLPSLLQSDANIFFLDETGFHLNMAPRRGYY